MDHNVPSSPPVLALISCICMLVSSVVIPQQFEYPIWVMQTFQIFAWTGAGVIAIITFIKFEREMKQEKQKSKPTRTKKGK